MLRSIQPDTGYLSWFGIFRLSLVQMAIASVVVLTNSTLNRVMVVELGLLAILPGMLIGIHYTVQMLRPRFGHRSDVDGKRGPWIIGGMVVLGLGGVLASLATALMETQLSLGIGLAVVAFLMIGGGVASAGTSLLALLATCSAPRRRPAAATMAWMMLIFGFVVTAGISGQALDPFSFDRLVMVSIGIAVVACLLSVVALAGIERQSHHACRAPEPGDTSEKPAFLDTLKEVWQEPEARLFTIFVFISMLAYSGQELILEPFGGLVFGMSVADTTKMAGLQNAGVLAGMLTVALLGTWLSGGSGEQEGGQKNAIIRFLIIAGCLLSSVALMLLTAAAFMPEDWPLIPSVIFLGYGNGLFAIAAISAMMILAGKGKGRREGLRMGLWGAAQAIGMGGGQILGAALVDLMRAVFGTPEVAYAIVFAGEALAFAFAAWLARGISRSDLQMTSETEGVSALKARPNAVGPSAAE